MCIAHESISRSKEQGCRRAGSNSQPQQRAVACFIPSHVGANCPSQPIHPPSPIEHWHCIDLGKSRHSPSTPFGHCLLVYELCAQRLLRTPPLRQQVSGSNPLLASSSQLRTGQQQCYISRHFSTEHNHQPSISPHTLSVLLGISVPPRPREDARAPPPPPLFVLQPSLPPHVKIVTASVSDGIYR